MGCSDIVFFAVGNTNHCDDVGDCTLGRGKRIIISCDWDNLYMVFFKKMAQLPKSWLVYQAANACLTFSTKYFMS